MIVGGGGVQQHTEFQLLNLGISFQPQDGTVLLLNTRDVLHGTRHMHNTDPSKHDVVLWASALFTNRTVWTRATPNDGQVELFFEEAAVSSETQCFLHRASSPQHDHIQEEITFYFSACLQTDIICCCYCKLKQTHISYNRQFSGRPHTRNVRESRKTWRKTTSKPYNYVLSSISMNSMLPLLSAFGPCLTPYSYSLHHSTGKLWLVPMTMGTNVIRCHLIRMAWQVYFMELL